MPNGHGPKEYGNHKYPEYDGTSDCEYRCGCWMGPSRSGGPIGLDPAGTCPNNPKNGKLLGGTADYEYVVTKRIRSLESRLHEAENRLEQVDLDKIKLADSLATAIKILETKDQILEIKDQQIEALLQKLNI